MNTNLFFLVVILQLAICINASALPRQTNANDAEKRVPTLLISLDGLRASKLDDLIRENPSCNFKKNFVDVGVKADHMKPSFPSLTFPNQFTLVTGKYIENHGIVGNSFYDPISNKKIRFLKSDESTNPKWWQQAKPVWMTAKEQGLKTFSFYWPGSDVWTRGPDMFMKYGFDYSFNKRSDKVVEWFKKLNYDFGVLYFNEPDSTGHKHGPDSVQYKNKVKSVDSTVSNLIQKFKDANLLDNMNIVVVSDHGMTQMHTTILVKDVCDMKWIDSKKTLYNIVSSIYPVNDTMKAAVYSAFKRNPNLETYYKEEMPERLHFASNDRIGPIIVVTKEGYSLRTSNSGTFLKGNHGFDTNVTSMNAIFMARGPSFKKNIRISSLKNVDIYPMLCAVLKIDCNKNDGSLDPFVTADVFTEETQRFVEQELTFN